MEKQGFAVFFCEKGFLSAANVHILESGTYIEVWTKRIKTVQKKGKRGRSDGSG
ncbi:MAG: hypothetical protein HFH75_06025 [Lachnospiraceae bacterium]|nr:hypothetical protein [Lachnospiraceae bacterium]